LVRGAVEAAVVALLAIVFLRTWLVQSFSVEGGSMAPTLLAAHIAVQCPTCGYQFAVGVEGAATDGRAANCPLCGSGDARLEISRALPADTVLVDKSAFTFRPPRRWEIASLRSPSEAGKVCVKRVVGLPGEQIAIRDGDVYVNGQVARKSLAEQRAVAIPVFEDRYRRPDGNGPESWQATAASAWQRDREGFRWQPRTAATSVENRATFPADALVYHHWRRDGANDRWQESPVVDSYGYNQTLPIRELHTVNDLLLSFRLQIDGRGALFIRGICGVHVFVAAIEDTGQASLSCDDRVVAQGSLAAVLGATEHLFEFSLIDRACTLAVDGEVVVEYLLPDARETAVGTSTPCAIGARGLSLAVRDLRVCRDLYYVAPVTNLVESSAGEECVLAGDEYFVLSDNSPVGFDSRYPAFGPAVPFKLFVGKPLVAASATAEGWFTGGAIQVPTLRQIRYIR